MRPPEKMVIYNLFPLLAGPFSRWERHFRRAREMRFNWIFVNPIQRPGASGSIYSIADYFSINPALTEPQTDMEPEAQLRAAVDSAKKLGLGMMIDLVINHCAIDSRLVRDHPKWFLWESEGRVAHPFARRNGKKVVWKDLARFDHRGTRDKEGLFRFFLRVIEHLVGLGFRGFRCDAAYQIPADLWRRLIGETKARHPEVVFLAETLGCPPEQTRKTASAGFDYVFNSSKWWDFSSPWLMEQYQLTRDIAPSISFPESHDTARLCQELEGNLDGLKQRYLFAALFSAGVMITSGFEFGFRRSTHVVKTTPADWEETSIDLTPFITKVNAIKEEYTILQEDAPTHVFAGSNPQVLIMWKGSSRTEEESLLILNKDIRRSQTFQTDDLFQYVQGREPVVDISPEYTLDYLQSAFSYDLRPGQGIVLATRGAAIPEDLIDAPPSNE